MKAKLNIIASYVGMILLSSIVSCKKFVAVDIPITSTTSALVFNSNEGAIASLTAVYNRLASQGATTGIMSTALFSGLSADELTLYPGAVSSDYQAFYRNSLLSSTVANKNIWIDAYGSIFMINSALEGLNSSDKVTPVIKARLIGEAKFLRAFNYFYLVNLYGSVPLILTTDPKINGTMGPASTAAVYAQIVDDLKDAQQKLADDYFDGTMQAAVDERSTVNRSAATAMLARVYLYMSRFTEAAQQAGNVIARSQQYDLVPVNDVFLKNSKEAIWQIRSVSNVFTNTGDARVYILPATGPNISTFPVYFAKGFEDQYDAGDQRRSAWLKSVSQGSTVYYYPYKYKVNTFFAPQTEYTMGLRLAEQYLIRAECRAELGDVNGAKQDLDRVRSRANATLTNTNDKQLLLDAILAEYKKEFFTEGGLRWLNLKRTGKITTVMPQAALLKNSQWDNYKQLYPIPNDELERNPGMKGHQNPGYN